MEGEILARYRLLEEIGKGGMAVVYRGEDTALNREVAVKVLHPILADREECRMRFQREAQVVAKLKHENILEIYDYSGVESPKSFIVTEFIHGRTLTTFLEKHAIHIPEVAALIAAEVCRALVHAHHIGVIHRDIKPENIMIREDGVVKLMDFGIAQIVDTQKLTLTGQLLGSPAYMAPEVVLGGSLDFRTDVFSLGVLLYRLSTGQLPFYGKNPHEVLKKIAEGHHIPPAVANPAVSEDMDAVIERALALEKEDRYQEVSEMLSDLELLLGDSGIKRPKEQVRAFFDDPKGYETAQRKQLITLLLNRTEQHSIQGQLPAALSCLNRVLALDEDNPTVPVLLRKLQRRKNIREFLRIGSLFLIVTVLVTASAVGLWYFTKEASKKKVKPKRPKTAEALSPSGDGGSRYVPDAGPPSWSYPPLNWDGSMPKTPGADGGSSRTGPRNHAARGRHRGRGRHRPAGPKIRVFQLTPYPVAVKVSVDNGPYRPYGHATRILRFKPGPHVIRLKSDYCYPRRIDIAPNQSSGVLRPRLRWRPASLKVKSNVSADVQAGRAIGITGRTMRIKVPKSSMDGTVKVLVKVSASGYHTWQRRVELQAGTTKTIRATLTSIK